MSVAAASAISLAPARAAAPARASRVVRASSSSSSSSAMMTTRPRSSPIAAASPRALAVRRGHGGLATSSQTRVSRSVVKTAATPAHVDATNAIAQVADGLEGGIQFVYLGSLLAILGFAGFIVVRQVLIRRELDESAKQMGERIRSGDATAEEYFEMGSIMLRKKVYTQAVRNLRLAAAQWEGAEEDLAQIHNALGFGYLSTDKLEEAVTEFKRAVELQPGYVTAWNNLGDALEQLKDVKGAMAAYEESLTLSPGNQVAENRLTEIKRRLTRLGQM